MPSASPTANTRGPVRRVIADTWYGTHPGHVLECGHSLLTSSTHATSHRCRACLRAGAAADARMVEQSESALMRAHRIVVGAERAAPVVAREAA